MQGESSHNVIIKSTGEAVAIEDVYKKCYSLLFAKAFSMLGSQESAQDAVQEMFLRIWERTEPLVIKTSIEAYLMVAIHHDCIKLLTKEERERKKLKGYFFVLQTFEEPDELVMEHTTKQEALAILEQGRKTLSKNQQEVVHKCIEESKTYVQVAAEMNIARNTVQSHIERSLTKFRNLFRQKCGPSL
jgi:RNA polymerase sigma factor (sigma-70 family)